LFDDTKDSQLNRPGKARRRDVESFLKIRADEIVRFIEYGERSELAIRNDSLDGDFVTGKVALHEKLIKIGV
jgi:hypothetical protein